MPSTTKAGRYVQGGGCTTVGVAGLIQSGGFGSFSKNYGMAAAGLLEAEIVTADGVVRIANACTNPDLFWAIKGGGGGSLGVVTQAHAPDTRAAGILRRRLHDDQGGVGCCVPALDRPVRRLLQRRASSIRIGASRRRFRPGNVLDDSMVFQGLDQQQAEAVWRPFLDWVAESPQRFHDSPRRRESRPCPARKFWDPEFLRRICPAW